MPLPRRQCIRESFRVIGSRCLFKVGHVRFVRGQLQIVQEVIFWSTRLGHPPMVIRSTDGGVDRRTRITPPWRVWQRRQERREMERSWRWKWLNRRWGTDKRIDYWWCFCRNFVDHFWNFLNILPIFWNCFRCQANRFRLFSLCRWFTCLNEKQVLLLSRALKNGKEIVDSNIFKNK